MNVFDPGPWWFGPPRREQVRREIHRAVWAVLALSCALALILVVLCVA